MVDAERLEILDVLKTCSLRDFVENTHQLKPYNPRRFFFEFSSAKEEITDDKEIILMDKVSKIYIINLYYDALFSFDHNIIV